MIKAKRRLDTVYRHNPHDLSRNNCLRLDMNESVSGMPESFIHKVLDGISAESIATYPACGKLERIVAEHNKLNKENICLSNGSDAAIKYIFDAFIDKNDNILLTNPTFAMYPVYCRIAGAKPISVDYNSDLSFPINRFLEKLTKNIRMVVIVNPNNPTGSSISEKDILCLVKKAARTNTLILVDEAYFYYYPHSVIKYIKRYDNLIVLRTFSKLLAAASLRLGFAAAAAPIIENLKKVKPTYDVNGIAVRFGEKLMKSPGLINQLIAGVKNGKRYLIGKLRQADIPYKAGEANFILINCGHHVKRIIDGLARRKILVSGNFPQPFLKNYIRITIGNKPEMEYFWKTFIAIWKSGNEE